MATCLIVQHLATEGPFAIAKALEGAGVETDVRRMHKGDELPADLSGFGGMVVMGGPMSAVSDDDFPWRSGELGLARLALQQSVPTLGVCLGAQVLAAGAGAAVYRGSGGPEIGWGTVTLSAGASTDPLMAGVPSPLPVMHWHGDTFDLPVESIPLASSGRYPNQAFRVGDCAWGLQFHVELDLEGVAGFANSFADEARAAGVDPGRIVVAAEKALAEMAPWRDLIAERFAGVVATKAGRQASVTFL